MNLKVFLIGKKLQIKIPHTGDTESLNVYSCKHQTKVFSLQLCLQENTYYISNLRSLSEQCKIILFLQNHFASIIYSQTYNHEVDPRDSVLKAP